ncbi:MAG: (2Fe-2S)-binding protein [Thermoprotei archaeon]|nr:(2Fe-2S)-binding protein [Thermoprotei archaeon]
MPLLSKKARVRIDSSLCRGCDFCKTVNVCYSPSRCLGYLSCYYSCPFEARVIEYEDEYVREVTIYVDKVRYRVPDGITVAEALRYVGFEFKRPGLGEPSLACKTGGCWACALIINGSLERTCITPVINGMRIDTQVRDIEPRRIVHGPSPHIVGGKATPW